LSAAAFGMKPLSRGRVRLAGPDPRTPLVIEHGLLSDPVDLEVLVDGLALLRRLGASEAMSRYAAAEVRPGLEVDPEQYIRETVRGYFHPVGTCALGSVVDARGAVIGVEGLYVADASIMPTIVRSNTNLSTLGVAEKIAAQLIAA
jgi:choline dehydrogenase